MIKTGCNLIIYVLETSPKYLGLNLVKKLLELNIHCILISDLAIGHVMEEIDYVLSGAQVITENGGIINHIGTYTMALCAKSLDKPFYVLAEHYKISRIFPLNQKDIKYQIKEFLVTREDLSRNVNIKKYFPTSDFTPPNLISFIVTDTKIFQPQNISDEMIEIFNF